MFISINLKYAGKGFGGPFIGLNEGTIFTKKMKRNNITHCIKYKINGTIIRVFKVKNCIIKDWVRWRNKTTYPHIRPIPSFLKLHICFCLIVHCNV